MFIFLNIVEFMIEFDYALILIYIGERFLHLFIGIIYYNDCSNGAYRYTWIVYITNIIYIEYTLYVKCLKNDLLSTISPLFFTM